LIEIQQPRKSTKKISYRLPKLTENFLATKTPRHEGKLATDFTDFADLFGQKKVQKTSAFVPIPLGLRTDRQRKIGRRLPKLTERVRAKERKNVREKRLGPR
jgi:hypothetical protein